MAHSKSAKKRIRINERNRLRNQSIKSRVKTFLKKFETALEDKELEAAKEALLVATKEMDKAVSKGIFHKNTISRKKSRLAVQLNKITSA